MFRGVVPCVASLVASAKIAILISYKRGRCCSWYLVPKVPGIQYSVIDIACSVLIENDKYF